MVAIAAISINDGQATPVSHTFNPITSVPASYDENGSTTVPVIGQSNIQVTLKRGQGSDAVNRAKISLRIPVLETASGTTYEGYTAPPKVAYYLTLNGEALLPNRSTLAQRKDLRVMFSNLLLNAQVVAAIDSLETPL